ncbi:MAG: hypothetical protein ACRDRV_22030 [Pseudonocardiaceae bacterium]
MTSTAPGWVDDGSSLGWVRWAYSARDGLVHAFPLGDSECGRWPLAVCSHSVPPAAVAAGVVGSWCPECVARVRVPGTGRRHRRIAPAGVLIRLLTRLWVRRAVEPDTSPAAEFPVIALPFPALGECAGRDPGTAGSDRLTPGLVPPCPVHRRSLG